ncbi:arylsulfatase I [Aplysia californica]|uniref:Arylsulfatase I n=1 Tax=Aplysia californica TaxID=6500 RepID=A0ABM1A241_APLCA|nr:arylsulfatase I [Aplysia californica]
MGVVSPVIHSLVTLSLVCALLCPVPFALAADRPHIILIVADDLGYNDVSFHGSDQIPTPNIDFLAYNGVLLNNYYVSPICTPTRSALLTGRHPIHTGMQHNVIFGAQPYGLPLNETLLPQYLNKLGYRSRIVGKWHLGMFQWEYTPLYRGFESHIGYYQGCEDYYEHTYEANLAMWGVDFQRDKDLLWNYTGQYSTEIFQDEAVNIIKTHNDSEPLFLYLPFQAVHSADGDGPHLQAPVKYIQRFGYIENRDRRIYAAMVSALDDAVGAVYDALKTSGMLQNSVIVFTTDNGGPANGFDYNAANNFPLRGVKATLWEGGVRGVGFLHSPLLHTQGYVSEQMLHVCDWLPTLYAAAGGDPSTLHNLDGFNAWDMLSRNSSGVRTEMLHNIDPIGDFAGVRVGDYKLLIGDVGMRWDGWYPPYQLAGDEITLNYLNFTDDLTESVTQDSRRRELEQKYREYWGPEILSRLEDLHSSGKKTGAELMFHSEKSLGQVSSTNWDRVRGTPVRIECGVKPANASTNCDPRKSPCLFHIPTDPCEYNNIAESHTEVVTALFARIKDYAATMVPPGNKPNDDRGNPKYHGGAWLPWM